MAKLIDRALRDYQAQHDKFLAEAKKRFDRFQKIAEKPRSPAEKKVAERNMEGVLAAIARADKVAKETMLMLKELRNN